MRALADISLRRVWLVARRDYLGYVKTWGFWISFFMPVIFGMLGFVAAQAGLDFQTQRVEAILDTTGEGAGAAIIADYREGFSEIEAAVEDLPPLLRESAAGQADEIEGNLVFVDPPAATVEALQPWLRGERRVEVEGREVTLDGLLHLYTEDGVIRANYWSRNVNANLLPNLAEDYFRERARRTYLESGGLSLEGWEAATRTEPIETFDPTKPRGASDADQAVTRTDRLPYLVAAGATLFLWLTIFSGSYMLLTSMLEEKLGKLLEMILATTQFVEVLLGKLLGVALLTLTALAPYIILVGLLGVVALTFGGPEVADGLRGALSAKMIVFFPVFLVLGYVFYGSLFIALGSLAESMQDAQTLTVPIMIVLTACVLIVPVGFGDPDAPAVVAGMWFPLTAPFAAIVRLPSDPSWLSLLGSAAVMLASTALVAWLATRMFRHGVLSGSGLRSAGAWFRRVVLRRQPSA